MLQNKYYLTMSTDMHAKFIRIVYNCFISTDVTFLKHKTQSPNICKRCMLTMMSKQQLCLYRHAICHTSTIHPDLIYPWCGFTESGGRLWCIMWSSTLVRPAERWVRCQGQVLLVKLCNADQKFYSNSLLSLVKAIWGWIFFLHPGWLWSYL